MTMTVFAIVLVAAALHASWNAIVKIGGDTLLTSVLVTASASLIAFVSLPLLPSPAPASWWFIAASTACQIAYFVLVARLYRVTNMSVAYPIMRGAAPLLVALVSTVWIGEPLSAPAWLGIGGICAGIACTTGAAWRAASNVSLALVNAVVIACYTLIDGVGVRRSGAPAAYTLWTFLLTGGVLAAWALVARRRAFRGYIRRNWILGLVGGVGTISSYGLALWAMTVAPIAVVAALRETSILFGVAISAIVLREHIGRARIVGAIIIAARSAALRLA